MELLSLSFSYGQLENLLIDNVLGEQDSVVKKRIDCIFNMDQSRSKKNKQILLQVLKKQIVNLGL